MLVGSVGLLLARLDDLKSENKLDSLLSREAAFIAQTITYLKEIAWSQDTLLNGANGIVALTFCGVPIQPSKLAL